MSRDIGCRKHASKKGVWEGFHFSTGREAKDNLAIAVANGPIVSGLYLGTGVFAPPTRSIDAEIGRG
jgi:hypothetical protein